MRFTWFNMSNGDNVSFNIDDFICYNSDDPPTSFDFEDEDQVNPVDTTKTFTISDCDSLDSWKIYTGDTLNLDTAKKTQGGASLAAQQTGGLGLYYKFPGTTDFSNVSYITFDFIPAAADMAAVADVRVMLSSRDFINEDNTNSNSWNEQFCDLDVSGFKTMTLKANEWNHVTIPMAGRTATEGFDITKVKKLGIQLLSYYTDERPAGTVNYEWAETATALLTERLRSIPKAPPHPSPEKTAFTICSIAVLAETTATATIPEALITINTPMLKCWLNPKTTTPSLSPTATSKTIWNGSI